MVLARLVSTVAPHIDSTLVKFISRAFPWQKMLETGLYAPIREIAKAEKINSSYVPRVLRLTLLAPATVEAMGGLPVEWVGQKEMTARRQP